ncbi:MAG TPA: cupin domain-containing protein, partial [Verrucomicrobiae bacterium]|nr:cupin domain-containing protein [Verrucomicrobiae bacterium]
STIVNAVLGKPERRLKVPDAAVRFTRGGFAHVAHNESDRPFRNVTIEFLPAQTGARNLCAVVIPDQPLNCPADGGAVATGQAGSSSLPEFESDQLRIGLLTLDQGATYAVAAAKIPPLLVALDGTEAEGIVRVKIQGAAGTGTRPLRAGDVQEVPADLPYELHSTGGGPSRFLVIAPKD